MKFLSTLSLIVPSIFLYGNLYAQVLSPGISAGVTIGVTKPFTDVTNADVNPNFGASVQYNASPFAFAVMEYNYGKLSRKDLDIYGKRFSNTSNRLTATANVALGQILNPQDRIAHYLLYNVYVGTGLGVIVSNISKPNALTPDGFGGITYKGTDLTIPLNLGFNFKYASYLYPDSPLTFNVNIQHNVGLTEMLDGYNPANSDNKMKDSFTNLNVGVKYNFGNNR
ncbi:MAG: hypothetical protein H7096_07260 [Flavobacterium sp.]|nr:hypothetical protein [Pedobacter sp.]